MGRFPGTSLAAVALLIGALVVLVAPGEDEPVRSARTAPAGTSAARIVRVVDGDTAIVDLGRRRERLRYIGIDAPESVRPEAPVDCFGPESTRLNRRLAEGRAVTLRFDAERTDRFGRLLAYVYVEERFINAELVRLGAATTLSIRPNTAHAAELSRLEREAKRERRGLWRECAGR